MSQDTKNPAEDKLDALLKTQAIQAQPDFAARTLARMHSDAGGMDEQLDALLAEQPLRTSATFAEETITRMRRPRPIIRFAGLAAAAAAVVLGFAQFLNLPTIHGPAHPQAEVASAQPASSTSSTSISSFEEPTLNELIALASPLADVAPLLDPDALAALNTLTRWQP